MPRRCKCGCGAELKPARQCTTFDELVEKKGYRSIKCLDDHTRAKNAEKEAKKKAEFKEMKDRVDSQGVKSKLMTRAQTAFNAYIRARDAKYGCISCGTLKAFSGITGSSWDTGHYRSRGATPALRFAEDYCFKQCVKCNRDFSGNIVNMRNVILHRIGQKRLDIIEGPHDPKKYTADDLRSIEKEYKEKLKQLTR